VIEKLLRDDEVKRADWEFSGIAEAVIRELSFLRRAK
jgi:hypothetical protein